MREVDVLLSTFKSQVFIEELLQSLSSQIGVKVNLIYREDSDTNQFEFEASLSNYSFKIEKCQHKLGNLGSSKSFLHLMRHTKPGNYVAFCDQDDIWFPNKLERALNHLTSISGPGLYCSNVIFSTTKKMKNSKILSSSDVNSIFENIAQGCTIVMNNAAANALLDHIPSFLVAHDHWSYFICANLGKVVYDPEPTMLYRIHDENEIGAPGVLSRITRQNLQKYLTRSKNLLEYKQMHFNHSVQEESIDLSWLNEKYFFDRIRNFNALGLRQSKLMNGLVLVLGLFGFFKDA
jgi:glycosyltransferase involved in cell wall biosynthesis